MTIWGGDLFSLCMYPVSCQTFTHLIILVWNNYDCGDDQVVTYKFHPCFYIDLLAFCCKEKLSHLLHLFIHSFMHAFIHLQLNGFGDSHFSQGYSLPLLLFSLLLRMCQIWPMAPFKIGFCVFLDVSLSFAHNSFQHQCFIYYSSLKSDQLWV